MVDCSPPIRGATFAEPFGTKATCDFIARQAADDTHPRRSSGDFRLPAQTFAFGANKAMDFRVGTGFRAFLRPDFRNAHRSARKHL